MCHRDWQEYLTIYKILIQVAEWSIKNAKLPHAR